MFQNIIEIIILSAIQGISEFLPISSSAHLILVSSLYEFKSNSLLIDISLHLGSLLAIIYFFRNELLDTKNNKRLLGLIILGSIPLIIVGYILYSTNFIYALRDVKVITFTSLNAYIKFVEYKIYPTIINGIEPRIIRPNNLLLFFVSSNSFLKK